MIFRHIILLEDSMSHLICTNTVHDLFVSIYFTLTDAKDPKKELLLHRAQPVAAHVQCAETL